MVEIVASLSTQMLHRLGREEKVSFRVIEITDQVMALVTVRRKIQYLLSSGHISEKVLNHIETIRDLAYKIEDVLETCAAEVAFTSHINDERCVKRFVRRYFGALNDGIKIIKAKISDIESDVASFRENFPDDVVDSIRRGEERAAKERNARRPRKMYPGRGAEEHFVGMDDEISELVSVVAKEEGHRIISVLGVEGLGKTTVARKVYSHPEVRRCFKAFAWVSLGPVCRNGVVLQEILRQLDPGKVKAITSEKKEREVTEERRVIEITEEKEVSEITEEQKVNEIPEEQDVNEVTDEVSEVKEEKEVSEIKEEQEVKEVTEEEQNMIDQLKEIQKQKSCFIVLDSICNIKQWKQISSAFQMQDAGTRILLTTREENIAKDVENIAKDVGFTYKLRFLSEDEGWELLRKHAFPTRKSGPDFGLFPRLGKEMVRKCDFLPLKISSLGRNLKEKISLSEWQMVSNAVAEYLQRDYHNEADESMYNILDSSYERLPYYLKQCFLYLGIFREDKDIDTEDLSYLWMAEGMVASVDIEGKESTMKEAAEYYLSQLASHSMLQMQVDEFSTTRRFKLCCLHNRARELALYQGQKEDFRLKILDFCDGKQPMFDTDHPRRLVIHFNKQVNTADDRVATDQLRSLLFLNSDQKYEDIPLRIPDFAKFKLLRVLHFLRCKFEGRKFPKGIDKLVNLRYIGLLYCDLDELPPSISNLRNLHVLNIRAYVAAQISIPNVFSKMHLLKHLHLPHYSDREQTNKLMLGDLLELETLIGFNSLIHDLSSLSKLKKLRHLVAHCYSNDSLTSMIKFVEYYGARVLTNLNIENKCNFTTPEGLTILEEVLICPNLHALTLSMVLIYKIPDCGMHVSPELSEIKLIGCRIKEDPMEALAKFPNLRKLCLGYGAFVGKEMTIRNTGFPTLEYLEFRGLPNLKELRVDEKALCNLSALTIMRCPKLEKIPDGLTSISVLKKLEIELAPEALPDGQEMEYHQKFEFVNSFVIRKLDPFSGSNNDFH